MERARIADLQSRGLVHEQVTYAGHSPGEYVVLTYLGGQCMMLVEKPTLITSVRIEHVKRGRIEACISMYDCISTGLIVFKQKHERYCCQVYLLLKYQRTVQSFA